MSSDHEKDRQEQRQDRDRREPPGGGSMTEKGLGDGQEKRDEAREERGREHDVQRRQMPINR